MPVYEYRCKQCGKTHEVEHGFHDARPTQCQNCGGQLTRVFHPVGVVFKGSGFHKTDYSSSGLRKEPAAASSGDATSTDGKAGSTGESATADTKSAAKTDAKPAATQPSKTGDTSKTKSSGAKP